MDDAQLVEIAWEARRNAYCPYSNYAVGSALLDEGGRVHFGCNVENVSYPAGVCAERTAIVAMAASGARRIETIAVATEDGGTPCGICLQVMLEFCEDPSNVRVLVSSGVGSWKCFTLRQLLPFGFSSKAARNDCEQKVPTVEPPARA